MTDLYKILERKFFGAVEQPMRYTGNELHCIRKPLETISLHGVLCNPEVYEIGMSHFGSQILYHIVNSHKHYALSRCYHPWVDAEKILRENKIPLYTLEYYTPVAMADWLGFTLQYELHYSNFINMLNLAEIPMRSADRDISHPIIICGGPCMTNPEPVADFIDAAVIGDAEEIILELCHTLETAKKLKTSRKDTLRALTEIPGVYVPSLYPVTKTNLVITDLFL